jgi:hypothetical protein
VLLEDKNAVKYGERGKMGRAVSNKQRRKGLEVDSKLVFIALCTEDILIAKESCCWAPSLETWFYV